MALYRLYVWLIGVCVVFISRDIFISRYYQISCLNIDPIKIQMEFAYSLDIKWFYRSIIYFMRHYK